MNAEQGKLYSKWKELEERVHWSAGIISYSDLKRVKEIRPRVWNELREFLSAAERLDLGTELGKTPSEALGTQWPPKNWKENEVLAYGANTRARSNLYFIEACLDHFHKSGTDPVYSRSLLILLSYSTELILESYNLLRSAKVKKDELIAEIKKTHNLVLLSQSIISDSQNFLGLKSCKRKEVRDFVEYVIDTLDGSVVVQDLKDIRYDFINYELRSIDPQEASNLRTYVEILLKMTEKIIEKLPQL